MKARTLLATKVDMDLRLTLATLVTDFYIINHDQTREVFDKLNDTRRAVFKETFQSAMMDSFEVLSKCGGVIHLVIDETKPETPLAFSMGNQYAPDHSPLSSEFSAKVLATCNEFFAIFAETFPLLQLTQHVTANNYASTLGDKALYYSGMTISDMQSRKLLAETILTHVFNQDQYCGIYTLISAKFEAEILSEADVIETRLVTHPTNGNLRMSVYHRNDPIIAAIVNLYQNYPLLETAKSDADLTEPSRIHDVSGSDNAVSLAKQIRTAGGSPTLTRDASARNVAEPEKQDVKTHSNGY